MISIVIAPLPWYEPLDHFYIFGNKLDQTYLNDDEMTTSNIAAESHTQNDEEMATSNNPGFHTFFFAVSFYILFSVVPFYFWASIRSFLRCRYTYFFRLSHFTFGLPYVPFCGVVTYLITRKTRFLQFFVVK